MDLIMSSWSLERRSSQLRPKEASDSTRGPPFMQPECQDLTSTASRETFVQSDSLLPIPKHSVGVERIFLRHKLARLATPPICRPSDDPRTADKVVRLKNTPRLPVSRRELRRPAKWSVSQGICRIQSLTAKQPPKRRAPAAAPPPPKEKAPRQSAIAKENNISAATESEIKEAFNLFVNSDKELPSPSLRRALAALGVPPASSSELQDLQDAADPDDSGSISYAHFVAVAALKLSSRSEESQQREVEDAFRLFTNMGGEDGKITIACLKRVAKALKEDVPDSVMRDMLLEANGGSGVGRGVGLKDFEGVMRRAGVFR